MQEALVGAAVFHLALAAREHPAKVTTVAQVAQATWLAVAAVALALLVALRRVLMAALVVRVQHLA
jgi:hypothetical protein